MKAALRVPVLANGGVLNLEDAHALMAYTGADGVLSAEPLLKNPALFAYVTRPAPCPSTIGLKRGLKT